MDINKILQPYNPWFEHGANGFKGIPEFQRPIFKDLLKSLHTLPQIISITGPRRVGKSTLLHQIIRHHIREGEPPQRFVFYSLDDPALFRPGIDRHSFMEGLMRAMAQRGKHKRVYLFLDEIQRLENWELYLKKLHDQRYPIRLVVSGSASSPIFKKSRESLLGRVKDYHLLPFSFREYLLYHSKENAEITAELEDTYAKGRTAQGMFAGDPKHLDLKKVTIYPLSDNLWSAAQEAFKDYICSGGFPEVWDLETWEQRTDYLYDNQVKKVIYEDLLIAAQFRKPEQLKSFYISLLERPGLEVNLSQIATETGVPLAQLEKYLPLLEMTDLIMHIKKFRKSALRVRRGNIKFYQIDLALRNAVLRLRDEDLADPTLLGMYAENLVFNALRKWPGAMAVDYYRERDEEVDFIVQLGFRKFLPFEVKYRESIEEKDLSSLYSFCEKFKIQQGVVVAKNKAPFGKQGNLFYIPLLHFLLLFD